MSTQTHHNDNPFRIDGMTALITGGGSGLGLGIAQCMVAAGGRVVLVGRRESELAKAARELGASASYVAGDVTRFEAGAELVASAERAAGAPIDILVNNAGIHLKKPADQTGVDEFESVLRTHVLAAHNLTKITLPTMLARGRGVVLFTASMASFMGLPNVVAYSAAKSAYLGMVRSLAAEVSGRGVRVNAIAPGWIETPMLRQALDGDPARKAKILARTPMGGFGMPHDIGHAAVYLSSPAARFVTGVVLPVDGGASIGF